jgi:Flp pilus assembly protein TadD
MATIPELLQAVAAACRSGQLGVAEQACHQVLQLDPNHAEALAQLGVLAYQTGRLPLAVEWLRRAAAVRPTDAGFRNNLGAVLAVLGHTREAETEYREALRLQPANAEAHNNLGIALRTQGRAVEAEAAYREALRLRPDYPEAHNSLGVALLAQGRAADAEAAYREALRLRSNYAEARNNLGNVFRAQDRLTEAEAAYREALRLRPNYADAHNNLGNVFRAQDRLTEAEAAYREAIRLRPNHAEAYDNLGVVLREQGRLADAAAAYREALRLRPDFAEAHSSLGMLLLTEGRFEEGWAEYEWRSRAHGLAPRMFDRPAWDGTPLNGRTLLLSAEQGVGDTLQFIRYAPAVKALGGTILLECPAPMVPLLSRCAGIDRLVEHGAPLPAFDVHAPLVSLPRLLSTTVATIPAAVPYLSAEPGLVAAWRAELAAVPGFKVGIAWQGNPQMIPYDRRRSFPLAALEPVARLAGVRLIALQKGHGREQLGTAVRDWPLTDLGGRLDEQAGAFMDTAAVLPSLDLVVTCDSSLAHLAGALGVRAWVALPFAADWRWLREREDSPWYPSLRLFRQPRPGDWATVFGRMADALRERLNP